MRAAQSKGIADLLVLWPVDRRMMLERPWLVQCKYSVNGGGRLPAYEEIELVALAHLTGSVPVLARPLKGKRGMEFINLITKEPIA
jgi:hypothetical protein